DEKGIARVKRAWNADDRDGVAGQDEAVGSKVSRVLRAEGAKTDPESERAEKENAFLGEESDEKKRYGRTNQCSDNAIDTLRQYLSALLRLRYDEDGEQRPIGLVEIEGEGDEQGEQPRRSRLGSEDQWSPIRADDCLDRARARPWTGRPRRVVLNRPNGRSVARIESRAHLRWISCGQGIFSTIISQTSWPLPCSIALAL